jgi:hypothetical protein
VARVTPQEAGRRLAAVAAKTTATIIVEVGCPKAHSKEHRPLVGKLVIEPPVGVFWRPAVRPIPASALEPPADGRAAHRLERNANPQMFPLGDLADGRPLMGQCKRHGTPVVDLDYLVHRAEGMVGPRPTSTICD